MANLISPAEYSRQRGVTRMAVSKAMRDGRISYEVVDGKKMIDPEKADSEWEQNSERDRSKGAVSGSSSSNGKEGRTYQDYRTMNEAIKAKLNKLELDIKEGKYILRDDVEKAIFENRRMVRDKLLEIPNRVSSEFAAIDESNKIRTRLDEEIRFILEELVAGL